MQPTERICDPQQINQYLDDQLGEAEVADFERHLNDCELCRKELHARSAEPELWREAVALLGHAGDDSSERLTAKQQISQAGRVRGILDSLLPSDDPEMLGRVGEYEISGVVGMGGMGAVLKGFDKSLRRVVAIKVMAPHLANSGSARARFQREARAAAAITHDNVIDTYGVSEASGLPYLVMPFARGPSLQKRIDESGPLTALEIVRIGRQIAAGLAAAHEQGLVHRDIKPANILLNEGIERLWITDFGVARAVDDASMTQTGVIAGTPQYMSPEQARGESVDSRSDLFSMGSVLYTACTGRPPFRSDSAFGILRRITDTAPRPIREINPAIPEWLCQIVGRLMAKHSADRFQSAVEVAELLEKCVAHLQRPDQVQLPQGVAAPSPLDSWPTREDSARLPHSGASAATGARRWRRRAVWSTACLLAFLGVGLAAAQFTKPADIAGNWKGRQWRSVSLATAREAAGWYTGSIVNSEGRRGVLQLEWSRLQRRYNGRWKMGDETSGSVTLRLAAGELRGAVSVDADSPLPPDRPRLREFSWKRAPAGDTRAAGWPPDDNQIEAPFAVEASVEGRITRIGGGVHRGAAVQKGDLIVEITPADSGEFQRLQEQASLAEQAVEAGLRMVQAKERELDVLEANGAALESRRRASQATAVQAEAASKLELKTAQTKVDAANAELVEYTSVVAQAKAEYERRQELFEQKIISQAKLEQAQQALQQAVARVVRAQATVEAAEVEVVAKRNALNAKAAKAKADLDVAVAEQMKAKAEQQKVYGDLVKTRQDLARAQKLAAETKLNMSRERKFRILAPCSGVVARVANKNQRVKVGDIVCAVWPEALPDALPDRAPRQPPRSRASLPSKPATDDVRVRGLAAESITELLDEARQLARVLRELKSRREAAEKSSATAQTRSAAQLSQEERAVELQANTAVAILRGRLETARKLWSSQKALSEALKQQVEAGGAPRASLLAPEQAAAATAAEVRQLERLLAYYDELLQQEGTTSEDDKRVVLEILTIQLEAARTKAKMCAELCKLTRAQFEQGESDVEKVLEAEQAEALAAAQLRRLETLIEYYRAAGRESD